MAIMVKMYKDSGDIKKDIQNAAKALNKKLIYTVFCSVALNIFTIAYIIFKLRIN